MSTEHTGSRSAAIAVARAMAKPKVGLHHGAIARCGVSESIYCARCQQWFDVWASPKLALALHEVFDHNPRNIDTESR